MASHVPRRKRKGWGLCLVCASHPKPLLPTSCILPRVSPAWLLGDQPHDPEVLTHPPQYPFGGDAETWQPQ